MKANEVKRGQEVWFGNIQAVVLEPCINSVLISFTIDEQFKQKYVSYNEITLKNEA